MAPRSVEGIFKEDAFKISAVAALIIGFIFFHVLENLDEFVSQSPENSRDLRECVDATITSQVISHYDRFKFDGDYNSLLNQDIIYKSHLIKDIDDNYYMYCTPGINVKIDRLRIEAKSSVSATAEQFRHQMDIAFDRVENYAVPKFIAWYYELPDEWDQMSTSLKESRAMQIHLYAKMREIIVQEIQLADLDATLEHTLSIEKEASTAWKQTVRDILAGNCVDSQTLEARPFDTVLNASLEDVIVPPFVSTEYLLSAAGAGIVLSQHGARITKPIVSKVMAKIDRKKISKAATKALFTALGSKVVRITTAGATVADKAAAGRLLPGVGGKIVGTFSKFAKGALIGIAAGVALRKLEEAWNRDDFMRKIINIVNEVRREIDEQLSIPGESFEDGKSLRETEDKPPVCPCYRLLNP